jgi:hypothetical protein
MTCYLFNARWNMMRNPTAVFAHYVTDEAKVQQLEKAVFCTVAVIFGVTLTVPYGPTKSSKKWTERCKMFLTLWPEVAVPAANTVMPKEQQSTVAFVVAKSLCISRVPYNQKRK